MSEKLCVYCGKNPVPHKLYWYNESLNIFFTPLRQLLIYNPLTRVIKTKNFDAKLEHWLLKVVEFLKIIKYQKNVQDCKIRRAQVLWEEALRRDIEMSELLLFGKSIDVYVAEKSENRNVGMSEKKIIFSGLPRPAGYVNKWLDLMDDKWLFKKKLIENNLPVPSGASVSSFEEAKKIFFEVQKPVIVKPRAGSRGRHSTTNIYNLEDLKKAFKIAKQLCFWVMVEEQIAGPVYRATVINFELAGVLKGEAPFVEGDGVSTVEELINKKNQILPEGVKEIVKDENVINFLKRQNLNLLNVIKKGLKINLSEKIGVNYGGSSSEEFEICHPDNKELFVKAAKILGDPIVGFDFIIPDIAKSYKDQKCGFIEVNSLPFINLHHDPLLGQPRNVAEKIWQMLGW